MNVIDNVLENVRLGMETNRFRCNQRRVSTLKYLGEIYNYQLIEADIIFNTLYGLITFGSCVDLSLSELDPPEHLFRIQLVCTLLDTCGQYFDRGQNKKKLDCFLVFFQVGQVMYGLEDSTFSLDPCTAPPYFFKLDQCR